jgi:hypothetical protein
VSELPDGRITWRLKQPRRRGETHRIMEPMVFIATITDGAVIVRILTHLGPARGGGRRGARHWDDTS